MFSGVSGVRLTLLQLVGLASIAPADLARSVKCDRRSLETGRGGPHVDAMPRFVAAYVASKAKPTSVSICPVLPTLSFLVLLIQTSATNLRLQADSTDYVIGS
jgi:hypothetical protein